MTKHQLAARTVIKAPAESIFAVLADPARHVAIDGTGWVQEPLDTQPISAPGQVFRMAMYHPNHPKGNYEMANRIRIFEPPRAISWEPGYDAGGGELRFGGWIWRYDLTPLGPSETEVTLSYDWSAVSDSTRRQIEFPPFSPDHLDQSLAHLTELVAS
jgi:hypothetical protein